MCQSACTVSYYSKLDKVVVAVGVVEQLIVAPYSCRGEDHTLIVIENLSATETLNAYFWSSPNGNSQWTNDDNDAFVAIAPLATRRLLVTPDHVYGRVLGSFVGGPDTVRVSLLLMHGMDGAQWAPRTF